MPALNWPEVREGKTAWAKAVRKKMGPSPSTSFFTLGQRFTELRNDPDHAWLKDYPYQVVRYSLKYLADAYARYKADSENAGKPRFKGRHFTVPAFTIPEAVRMDRDRLYVPKVGWLRLAGSDPYAGCRPLTVRVRMEGTEQHPKWYAYVCYEVPAEQAKQPAADGALGLDRNVGQATDSEGTVYAMPTTTTRLRGKDEDPPYADHSRRKHKTPAFLLPETHEPDARDEPLPRWTRPPVDWREEHDLIAGRIQLRGLAAPGAPIDENPSALRLKLPGADNAAQPVDPGATHDDRAWVLAPYLFTPRDDGGWNVTVRHTSRLAGTVADTGTRVELYRADQWSTLLAVVEHARHEQLLEAPLLGRTLGLAKLVFDTRWPAGPPVVRLPDEYRKPKKAAPAPRRRAAARGTPTE